MKAALISIGDEILSGNTIDTNSNYIAQELKKIGISVQQVMAVQDEIENIKSALKISLDLADIVITTGGLGPTKDDKTKIAFASFFEDHLVTDKATDKRLRDLLKKRRREHIYEFTKTQAQILSRAKVFENDNGTAPCQMIEKDGKITFCLPGVPYEAKPLVRNKIIPFLAKKYATEHIVTRTVSVVGIPESLLAHKIEAWENALPDNITLSYLPVGNRIKLRLTSAGKELDSVEKRLSEKVEQLRPLIGEKVIAWDGDDIQQILKEVLTDRKLTISSAESCTGGEISKLLTSLPGSGEYYLGGITAYDFHKKIEILHVSEKTIDEKTVVSEDVAQEMSIGCQRLFSTDIAVSTTGVAGPEPDQFGNPVGIVYYSIRIKDFERTHSLFLPHLDRGDFIKFVSQRVLQDLVGILTDENQSAKVQK